jgi:hypothetical protein
MEKPMENETIIELDTASPTPIRDIKRAMPVQNKIFASRLNGLSTSFAVGPPSFGMNCDMV